MKIEEIDKNFAVANKLSKSDIKVYDAAEEPFRIYGVTPPSESDKYYSRLDYETAVSVSNGVRWLRTNTAGGRVRFKTDSDYIAIKAVMDGIGKMSHFPLTGSAGFDMYAKREGEDKYMHTFTPPFDITDGYVSEFRTSAVMREYTIHFPLYSNVLELYIILDEKANVLPPDEYEIDVPVVYYGSSITQGGCASRPGNAYPNIISRTLNCDHINLGFSGSAVAEKTIAEYISKLKMSVFVYDYDYNSGGGEYLQSTHYPMYKIIRDKNPALPIICVSLPVASVFETFSAPRRDIIFDTVRRAREEGDENIYFIDGRDFGKLAPEADGITVDGCHPNDLGFSCMAKEIGKAIEKVLFR